MGKGENAGYGHFLLFPQCFQKLSISGSLKINYVVKNSNAGLLDEESQEVVITEAAGNIML